MAGNPTLLPQTAVDLLALQPKLQQRLSRLWAEANSDVLRDSASVPFRARMLSQRQRGSTHPLEAIPSCEALTMPNDTCQLFLKNYQAIPEIALASFNNPSGLIRSGNNVFEESPNSGVAISVA